MRAYRGFLHFIVALSLLSATSSCSQFDRIKKSSDVNLKLTKANEYYDKKKYQSANELYHDLLPILRGTKNYEQLFYRYTYSFYYQKEYPTAALYFKQFTEYFPTSRDADECEFMHALCLVKMAPKSNLDQTSTLKAMEALQSYINTHPDSKRLTEANGYVEEARLKLESKEADAAKLYFNIGQFKAASIAFRDAINQYPGSPNADYYQFMVVKSLYQYASISIPERQAERYANTIDAYRDLKTTFPNSHYVNEGGRYEALASSQLSKTKQP